MKSERREKTLNNPIALGHIKAAASSLNMDPPAPRMATRSIYAAMSHVGTRAVVARHLKAAIFAIPDQPLTALFHLSLAEQSIKKGSK